MQMEKQEFYERAQKLRNLYSKNVFENTLISFIVYWERDEYRKKVEKLVDELGIVCEYAACALKQVLIIKPKFK